jgi:glucokinase
MGKAVLAVDLGGTNLRLAAVASDGQILWRGRCSTPHEPDGGAIVDAIAKLARDAMVATGASVDVIGVAVPASVMDDERGIVYRLPNIPTLNGFPLSHELNEALGLSVILENDATCAAVGEQWLGAARGYEDTICITLGTGVGGGIIIDGKPLLRPGGTSSEIGHFCVEPEGHPCGCGSWGCVEQYASATAVVRMAKELAGSSKSVLSERSDLTATDIYEAATAGDPVAEEAFRRMGYHLGIVLAGLINVLNPDVIVLAGGLSMAWDAFIEHLRDQISKRAFREPAARVKLVRAELGDNAGILGIARLAFAAGEQGLLEG